MGKVLQIIVPLLFSFKSMAYTPTIESLFRNGPNKEIDANTIVIELSSRKLANENEEPQEKIFYKYIFNVEKDEKYFALQLGYINSFAKENLKTLKFWPSFHFEDIVDLTAEQKVTYSLLTSLGLNDGRMILHFLRERGSQLKFNKEILNENQKLLLEKYMYFLSIKNQNGDTELVQVDNPLLSEDSEKQAEINELLSQSFYRQSPLLKYVRSGKEFKWRAGDVFTAIFNYESHHLEQLTIPLMDSSLRVSVRNPILYKGKYELPSHLYIKLQNDDKYHIEILDYYRISEERSAYLNRVQRYQTRLEENKSNLTKTFPYQPLFY
jgi:hypothetical protein